MSDKREKIIIAATALFEKDGFWNTSTANISKEAGIAAGTLFRYFATKEQLIDELFLELKKEVAACMYANTSEELDVKSRLQLIWNAYVRWNLDNPGKFVILEQLEVASRISSSVKSQVVDMNHFTVKTFQEGIKSGEVADYPILFLANFLGSSSNNVVRQLLDPSKSAPTKKATEALIDLGFAAFWKGIAA